MISLTPSLTTATPAEAARSLALSLGDTAFLEEFSSLVAAESALTDTPSVGISTTCTTPTGNPLPPGNDSGKTVPVVPESGAGRDLLSIMPVIVTGEHPQRTHRPATIEHDAPSDPMPTAPAEPLPAAPIQIAVLPTPAVALEQTDIPTAPQRAPRRQDHAPTVGAKAVVAEPVASASVAVQVTTPSGTLLPPSQPITNSAAPGLPLAPTTSSPTPSATAPQIDHINRPNPEAVTRIVEQLAVAREAMAPATVALTLDHAELGDLALRFNQSSQGALNVHITASDPQAHQAIAAAVGQQPVVPATTEGRNTSGQGHNPSPRGQDHAPGEQGHGPAHDRHTARDHARRHSPPTRPNDRDATSRHGGIFA